jgi:tetratricopeptide (TPR) repeat protein
MSRVLVGLALVALLAAGAVSCNRYFDMKTVEAIVRLENPTYRDKPVPRHVVDELGPVVEDYRAKVSEYVDDADQLQLLYKNLAQRYLDIGYYEQQIEYYTARIKEKNNPPAGGKAQVYYDYAAIMLMQKKLYAAAYDNLQQSLKISPNNEFLLYYSGYCAALMGKALKPENEGESLAWLAKAVKFYDLALEIDDGYGDALYGKAVILVYETGSPEEAIPLLLRLKAKSPDNTDGRFVLAAAYAATGDARSAITEYEEIERTTAIEEKKKAARENIDRLNGRQ